MSNEKLGQMQLPGFEDVQQRIDEEQMVETPPPAPETGYKIPPPPGAEAPEADHVHCTTAFVVVINEDGKAIATSDVGELFAKIDQSGVKKLIPERQASMVDMRRAALEVLEDLRVLMQAQITVEMQMATAQQKMAQMQQAAEAQRIAQTLDLGRRS
jgi:hypothetical protein